MLEPWFDDPRTQRFLGGRGWLHRAIALVAESPGAEFRGRRVLSRHAWVVYQGEAAVALVDVERYDDATAGVALVVAPRQRGLRIGRAVLLELHHRIELTAVRRFIGAIEPENDDARRCVAGAGFEIAAAVDEEGMLRIQRHASDPMPSAPPPTNPGSAPDSSCPA